MHLATGRSEEFVVTCLGGRLRGHDGVGVVFKTVDAVIPRDPRKQPTVVKGEGLFSNGGSV